MKRLTYCTMLISTSNSTPKQHRDWAPLCINTSTLTNFSKHGRSNLSYRKEWVLQELYNSPTMSTKALACCSNTAQPIKLKHIYLRWDMSLMTTPCACQKAPASRKYNNRYLRWFQTHVHVLYQSIDVKLINYGSHFLCPVHSTYSLKLPAYSPPFQPSTLHS